MSLVNVETGAQPSVPLRVITPDDVRANEALALYVRTALTPWLVETSATSTPCRESRVYFIQSGGTGAIKIGKACSPATRLATLQVGSPSPLRLIGSIAGGIALERKLHARFSGDRLQGEWFTPSAALLSFIREALA